MHNQSFSLDVVNTYRAWDTFSRIDDDDNRIIDTDVVPRYANPLVFESSEQVAEALDNLLDRAPYSGDYRQFTADKLKASLLHLRLLAGEKVSLREHVQTAMGATPEEVDEVVIDDYRTRMDDQLAKHGLGFDRLFEDALVIEDDETALRERLTGLSQQAKAVTEPFVSTAGIPEVQSEIVSVDKEWVGAVDTDDNGELFEKTNIHPRHKHTLGRLAAIVMHERMGHITQLSIWRDSVLSGDLDPVMGLETLHTPGCTQAEFNALAIEQLGLRALAAAGGKDAWQYAFQADYHDYMEMVSHNAHIRINSGYKEQLVIDYAAERLPFNSVENIAKAVPQRRKDPMLRGYMACYEPAMAVGRLLLAKNQAAQKKVLQQTFWQPMTLPQIRELVTS